jgi:hypothetical protein
LSDALKKLLNDIKEPQNHENALLDFLDFVLKCDVNVSNTIFQYLNEFRIGDPTKEDMLKGLLNVFYKDLEDILKCRLHNDICVVGPCCLDYEIKNDNIVVLS